MRSQQARDPPKFGMDKSTGPDWLLMALGKKRSISTPTHLGAWDRALASPNGRQGSGDNHGLIACQLLDVRDVIPRVAVKRLLQPQLVKVVADETNGAAQHEQAIEAPEGHQVITLFTTERAAGADHVHKGHGDAPVHIQNQVCTLARRQLLHLQSKVQNRGALEVRLRILLDEDHALVWVSERLDAVPDAHDELVSLLHLFDEVLGAHAAVMGSSKHLRRIIQSPSEARADRQQATAE